jgi:hypothetical protein
VFFFLVHLLVRRLIRVVAGGSAVAALEVENAVLRHQLGVLRRSVTRPELRRRDRVVLAAASGLLPRGRWSAFVVSPQTLLRWQRELVRRKWTYRRRPAGREGCANSVSCGEVVFVEESAESVSALDVGCGRVRNLRLASQGIGRLEIE